MDKTIIKEFWDDTESCATIDSIYYGRAKTIAIIRAIQENTKALEDMTVAIRSRRR